MTISCPACNTSIEVSKFLVGQKGRCPQCESKFIIPDSVDEQVLPPEPQVPVAVVKAHTEGAPARPIVVKQSAGVYGFLFAIVLAALVGLAVYVLVSKPPVDVPVEVPVNDDPESAVNSEVEEAS